MLFIMSVLSCMSLSAQDTIVFKTGSTLIADVTLISEAEIRYKEYTNPEGPEYVVRRNLVERINFSNGDTKSFIPAKQDINFGRNIISYHLIDIIYGDFVISYERILDGGKKGLRFPLAIGFNSRSSNDSPYDYADLGFTGAAIDYYFPGQGRVAYFFGPEIDIGIGRNFEYVYNNPPGSKEVAIDFVYGRLLINNGFSISPTGDFRLMAMTGLGIRYYDRPDEDNGGLGATVYITFSMGYRF